MYRKVKGMDWLVKMNAAIEYMEENLDNEIDLVKAGKLAGCSASHFQRVFSYMANTTVAEYIRRRRLTCAAFDLQGSGERVLDVALRYGYDSPTSFTRAFASLHGITPSEARKDGSSFVSYPPISFQMKVQGAHAMKYRIESKDTFRLAGIRTTTTLENGQAFKDIPAFWDHTSKSGKLNQMVSMMDTEIPGVFGVNGSDHPDANSYDYYIAIATGTPLPDGMYECLVPAGTWAVFDSIGPLPEAMQNLQKQIYTEWLPSSGYEYNPEAPDIEVYSEGNQQAADYPCQVWLPLLKR